jgi:hypothetical protein
VTILRQASANGTANCGESQTSIGILIDLTELKDIDGKPAGKNSACQYGGPSHGSRSRRASEELAGGRDWRDSSDAGRYPIFSACRAAACWHWVKTAKYADVAGASVLPLGQIMSGYRPEYTGL